MADLVKTRWLLMRPFSLNPIMHILQLVCLCLALVYISLLSLNDTVHSPPGFPFLMCTTMTCSNSTSNRGSYIQFTNDNEIKHAIPRWQSIHPTDHLSDEQPQATASRIIYVYCVQFANGPVESSIRWYTVQYTLVTASFPLSQSHSLLFVATLYIVIRAELV